MARTDILYNVPSGDVVIRPDEIPSSVGTASWSSNTLTLPTIASGQGAFVQIPYSTAASAVTKAGGKSAYAVFNGTARTFYPYELVGLSPSLIFYVRNESGTYYIYSGECSDFQIGIAKPQNTSLLLLCKPGNSRRYPVTGVHIKRYINSHLEQSPMTKRIISEFSDDGVSVISAVYDEESGNIDMVTHENEE
jgi:hypothetical protein